MPTTRRKIIYFVLLLLILLTFVLLTRLFIANYGRLRYGGALQYSKHFPWRNGGRVELSRGLSLADVDSIAQWMTFDYINRVFNLPADYLKAKLVVADPKYPRLTIFRAAAAQRVSTELYLGNLKDAVRSYLASSTPE